MNFPQEVITTLYTEGTAIALIMGLMVYTAGLKKKNGVREHIFIILNAHALLLALSGALSHALRYQDFDGALLLAKIAGNLHEFFILALIFYWMLFTDYLLYRSRDHLYRRYTPAFIPIPVFAGVLAVNSFTNFLFDIGEDLKFDPKPGYWVLVALEYLYLINTVVLLLKFYSKSNGPKFIRVLPFATPFIVSSVINRISPYEVRSLGIAAGLVLLHFSLRNERCYRDEETGFYNIAFLKYIAGFATEHDASGGCAIIFDGAERGDELAGIVRDEAPDNSAVVIAGHGRYIVLSGAQSRTAIRLFITAVKEAAEEESIDVSADHLVLNGGESLEKSLNKLINKTVRAVPQ